MTLALERYGTMDLPTVLAPAIGLAREGFVADWYLALAAAKFQEEITAFPETAKTYLRGGRYVYRPPGMEEGDRVRYPELARKTGLASLLSVPLFAREKVTGTINIYTREPRSFTDEEVGFVKAVAGQAAIAIENARLMSETLEMKRTLEARKLVERAKGILQHKHSLTEEEAYLRLRNESRRLRRPMRDLAEAVILADDLEKKGEGSATGS